VIVAKEKGSLEKKSVSECCAGRNQWSTSGGIYCLGTIGAAIYYISTAAGFWAGVLGLLKALVWPAFMVYEMMKFLGM